MPRCFIDNAVRSVVDIRVGFGLPAHDLAAPCASRVLASSMLGVGATVVDAAGAVRISIDSARDMFGVEGAVAGVEAGDKRFETGHCG